MDPYELAQAAASDLAARTHTPEHEIAIICGSGWSSAADQLGQTRYEFSATELRGFSASTVPGHGGTIRSIFAPRRNVLVFLGRTHLYERRNIDDVCHSVRTAAAAGAKTIVLTNGCGGLNTNWQPGTPVLISDHINLTSLSPIYGANFIDLTDVYSSRLRELCHDIDPGLAEGVYVQLPGPHYETPAEIQMIRTIGGDLVGMSTVLEAIAAREAGMEVLGISLVTNQAAGMTGRALDHLDVLETGNAAAAKMGRLISEVLTRM